MYPRKLIIFKETNEKKIFKRLHNDFVKIDSKQLFFLRNQEEKMSSKGHSMSLICQCTLQRDCLRNRALARVYCLLSSINCSYRLCDLRRNMFNRASNRVPPEPSSNQVLSIPRTMTELLPVVDWPLAGDLAGWMAIRTHLMTPGRTNYHHNRNNAFSMVHPQQSDELRCFLSKQHNFFRFSLFFKNRIFCNSFSNFNFRS